LRPGEQTPSSSDSTRNSMSWKGRGSIGGLLTSEIAKKEENAHRIPKKLCPSAYSPRGKGVWGGGRWGKTETDDPSRKGF